LPADSARAFSARRLEGRGMTTLIVGCGYLGIRVAAELLKRGERVLGTSRRARRAEEFGVSGIETIVLDVFQPDPVEIPEFDRLVYCVGFDRTVGHSRREVYVDGLTRFLQRLEGRRFQFVYAGSTSVYGQNDGSTVIEDDPTVPDHEAGQVCLAAEIIAVARGASVLRLAGLYGPGRIIRRAALLAGEPIVGDAEKAVNLIHIDDAATSVIAALDGGKPSRVYNVADDRPVSRRELYTLTAACLGAPAPTFRPLEDESGRAEADRRIGNRRMKEELGVRLRYPDVTTGIPASIT
jgi:nucleoside-diphosphate-sugar epimerase